MESCSSLELTDDTQSSTDTSGFRLTNSPTFYEPNPELFAVIDPSCLHVSYYDTISGEPEQAKKPKNPKPADTVLLTRGQIQFTFPTTRQHLCVSPSKCRNPAKCIEIHNNKSIVDGKKTRSAKKWNSFCPVVDRKNTFKVALIVQISLLMLFEIIRICLYYAQNGIDSKYGQLKRVRAAVALCFCIIIFIGLFMRNLFYLFIGIGLVFFSSWFIAVWETSELIHWLFEWTTTASGSSFIDTKNNGKGYSILVGIAVAVYFIWPILLLFTAIQHERYRRYKSYNKSSSINVPEDDSSNKSEDKSKVDLNSNINSMDQSQRDESIKLSTFKQNSESEENSLSHRMEE